MIDDQDRALLTLLQRDCRLSNAELADKLGLSTSACWRRVKALEDAGIISGYGARVRPEALGLGFQALVHVQLARHDPEGARAFDRAVADRREVMECYATTGEADYQLRVVCTDIAAYNRFLEEFLFTLPAVRAAQTNVVLREVKRAAALAL